MPRGKHNKDAQLFITNPPRKKKKICRKCNDEIEKLRELHTKVHEAQAQAHTQREREKEKQSTLIQNIHGGTSQR